MRSNNVRRDGIISGDDRGDSLNTKSLRGGKKTRII